MRYGKLRAVCKNAYCTLLDYPTIDFFVPKKKNFLTYVFGFSSVFSSWSFFV